MSISVELDKKKKLLTAHRVQRSRGERRVGMCRRS